MNIKEALEIVEKRLVGIESIPISIRQMKGVDENEYDELINSISFLTDYFREKENVPKILALAFVDVSNYFFVPNLGYSKQEQEKLEDYGIKLSELANQLFDS